MYRNPSNQLPRHNDSHAEHLRWGSLNIYTARHKTRIRCNNNECTLLLCADNLNSGQCNIISLMCSDLGAICTFYWTSGIKVFGKVSVDHPKRGRYSDTYVILPSN